MQKLNRFLRGWAGYFRYGNSAWEFSKLRVYAALRFLLWWTNRRHWRRPNVCDAACTASQTAWGC